MDPDVLEVSMGSKGLRDSKMKSATTTTNAASGASQPSFWNLDMLMADHGFKLIASDWTKRD